MTAVVIPPTIGTTGNKTVIFSLEAPRAKKVLVAGDFTDWENHARPLKKNGGMWETKVTITPGHHEYKFIVDGEWQVDPACGECQTNAFGTPNNIIEVR